MRSNRFTGITDVKVTTLNGTVLDTDSSYITLPTYLTPQSLFIPDISYEGEHNSLFSNKGIDWALALDKDTPRNERKPRLPLYDINNKEVGVIEVNKSGMVYVTPLEQETAIEQPKNVYVFATLVSNPEIETVYLVTFTRFGEGFVLKGSEVNFTATAPNPIPYLSVDIQGSQELNGYDKPWVGGRGKNLLPDILNGGAQSIVFNGVITLTVNDGKFVLNGGRPDGGGRNTLKTMTITLPAGTYTLSKTTTNNDAVPILEKREDNSIIVNLTSITSKTFTLDEETNVFVGFNAYPDTQLTDYTIGVQLEKGDTATEWTPYENICPITSYDSATITQKSKNLFSGTLYNGQVGSDGTWSSSTTRLSNVSSATDYTLPIKVGTYTLSAQGSDLVRCTALVKSADGTIIDNYATSWQTMPLTFNVSQDGFLFFTLRASNTQQELDPTDYTTVQVESGSTVTSYEPYEKTYEVELTNAGNVYKGTLDATSGKLVVESIVLELDGSSDEVWSVWNSNHFFYYVRLNSYVGFDPQIMISNQFEWIGYAINGLASAQKGQFLTNSLDGVTWNGNVSFLYDDVNNLNGFKTYIASNPIQLKIDITPQTYTLTPVQLSNFIGTNKITADAGNVTAIVMPDSL